MKLSLSVIAYNRPALLYRALNSVLTQSDNRWQLVIVNDNSGNPEVEYLSQCFVNTYGGEYINTGVRTEDRLKQCRQAVCLNLAMQRFTGDVYGNLADDMEFANPDAVKIILDYFEQHPAVGAGYVGCAYRMAEFRTGRILRYEDVSGTLGLGIQGQQLERFKSSGLITRTYSPEFNYGKRINKVFSVLDGCQVFCRKEYAAPFPEGSEYWMGEDAPRNQAISDTLGGLEPIGDPEHNWLIFSNMNEASLTIQGSPERSIAVTAC
jgi:hypothetical protein